MMIKNSTGSNPFTNPVSMTNFTTDTMAEIVLSTDNTQGTTATVVGVSIALLIILSMILMIIIITVVLTWSRRQRRRSTEQNLYTDSPYSTYGKEIEQQSTLKFNDPIRLYDQIHFCPSTGQTKFNLTGEIADMNNPNLALGDSLAGNDIVEHSSLDNTMPNREVQESTKKQPVYAVVDKTRKKERKKAEDPQSKEAKTESLTSSHGYETSSPHTVEYLYTAVKKKPKGCETKGEEETPPIPPHTVEKLYTAVQKKPKSRPHGDNNKDEPTPNMVHTVTTRGKPSHNMTEDLYAAAITKPKDTETAPPIPPHTVEELYTAVVKTPKGKEEN